MNSECARCKWRDNGCGTDFTPYVEYGDCGHCDGCNHFDPKKEEENTPRQANETVREICAEIETQRYQTSFPASQVLEWRDRILAAYNRVAKESEAK